MGGDDETNNKILIAFGIAIVSFVSAIAPMKIIQVDEYFFSAGNLLASGVLLSAGLVHQLPESILKLQHSLQMKFPIGPFVTGLTFCGFLILEEYLHSQFSHGHDHHRNDDNNNSHHDGNDHHHKHQNDGDHEHDNTSSHHHDDDGEDDDTLNYDDDNHSHHNHTHNHHSQSQGEHSRLIGVSSSSTVPAISKPQGVSSNKIRTTSTASSMLSTASSHHCCNYDVETGYASITTCRHETSLTRIDYNNSNDNEGDNEGGGLPLAGFRSKTFALEHQHHHHHEHVAEHMHGSLLASVILLFALSIHSIFEGIAIGISSNRTDVISTTTAVLAHKAFAGYALGSSMVASQMNEQHFFVLVSVFAFCSVLGIFLGMIFEQVISSSGKDSTATGFIQAIVAGTFLYVSIVEIALKEILLCRDSKVLGNTLSRRDMEWSKLVAFLIGYLAMSYLAVYV
jgi:zinc transporter ZupT